MDITILKNRQDELQKANYLWNKHYGQLEREFDEYKKRAATAQRKANDYIFKLKAMVEVLQKELNKTQAQRSTHQSGIEVKVLPGEQQMVAMRERLEQEVRDIRQESRRAQAQLESAQLRCRELEIENGQLQEDMRRWKQRGAGSGGDGQRVGQLQEECEHLRHQIDALHGEKEKLQKASAFLVTQLNLKIASENQLMNNYMRSQRDLEKESKRFAVLERAKAKAERELQIFKEYGKSVSSGLLQLQLVVVDPSNQGKMQCDVPVPSLPQNLPEVTTEHLVNFTSAIASKWYPVGHGLGVGEKAASLWGSEKSAEDKCLQILQFWIERGIDCTWEKLIGVLCQQGLNAVAQKICHSLE